MTKHQQFQIKGRLIISLLLVFSCVIIPMTGPVRALSLNSHARDRQSSAARREAGKSPDAGGVQFKSLPLRFELNAGQTDPQVRFIARSQSGDVFLTAREMVLCVRETSPNQIKNSGLRPQSAKPAQAEPNRVVIRLQTVNANPAPRITGIDPLPGKTNYFIGGDPKKWRSNIPSYAKVKYENIYPGIDLIYYDNGGNLEYDFNVAPGADPSRIALAVDGADGVRIDDAGDLVMRTAAGEVRQHAPRIYQQDGSRRREIAGGYKLLDTRAAIQNPKSKIQNPLVAFDLASYDAGKPLVIDPEVVFATYFGGSSETVISAIAVDASGSVYVTGHTFSHDFPTKTPLQSTNNHSQGLSAIITKFSPDGASLVYSTYLGGSNFASESATGIALDSSGAAYVTGNTSSTDFPTRNPIQGSLGGHLFVSKISPDGASLVYSTYLGSSGFDNPKGIKLDGSNNAYVYGWTSSNSFPTQNPAQATFGGVEDGFISIVSTDGSQLLFSTYLGGNDRDDIKSLVVVQQTGDVYVCGETQSSNFAGNDDSIRPFFVRFAPSTGTPSAPNQRLTGVQSQDPIVRHPVQIQLGLIIPDPPRSANPFPAALTGSGEQLGYSSVGGPHLELYYWGGCLLPLGSTTCTGPASFVTADANNLSIKSITNITVQIPPARDVVLDSQGAVYATGSLSTNSPLFPLVNPVQSSGAGRADVFVTVFAPVTRQIIFSTYLGGSDSEEVRGIALDPQGNMYIAGKTSSPNFPTKNAYQATPPGPGGVMQGQGNSFIVKLSAIGPIQTGPDFSLSFDSPTVTAEAGTKAKIRININRTGGFAGNVTVTPDFPGHGLKPKPPEPITTTDTVVVFKYKTGAAIPGQYPLTLTGTDDSGKTRTATVTLILQ